MPPSGSEWIDLGGGIEAEVALETSSAWHVRALHQGGVALTWQHAIEELEAGRLGVQLSDLISRSPHAACFWETAPITSATAGSTRFSFVTLAAPHLAQASPDEHSFAKHFTRCAAGGAVHFKSLGGDATLVAGWRALVVPPQVDGSKYRKFDAVDDEDYSDHGHETETKLGLGGARHDEFAELT